MSRKLAQTELRYSQGPKKKPMLTYYITRTVRGHLRKEARWFETEEITLSVQHTRIPLLI